MIAGRPEPLSDGGLVPLHGPGRSSGIAPAEAATPDGAPNGTVDGAPNAMPDGTPNGAPNGMPSASPAVDLSGAEAALRQGRIREVLPELRRLAGHHPPALSKLVRLLALSGHGAEALAIAREAFDRRDFALAETLGQATLDAGFMEAPAYYLLAACAAATGREQTAADLARVGVALDPRPERAQAELAALYLKQGAIQEAIKAAESVPGSQRDRRLREILGLAYASARRPDAARAMFRALLAEDPDNALAAAALRRLAPPPIDRVLDGVAAGLKGELAVMFACLRRGPATEAELAVALTEAGYRRVLVKGLIRELVSCTQVGAVPLVRVGPETLSLDLATLDAKPR